MNFKEKMIEMAERLYDLAREGKYDVKVDLAALKKAAKNIKVFKFARSEIPRKLLNGVQKTIKFGDYF